MKFLLVSKIILAFFLFSQSAMSQTLLWTTSLQAPAANLQACYASDGAGGCVVVTSGGRVYWLSNKGVVRAQFDSNMIAMGLALRPIMVTPKRFYLFSLNGNDDSGVLRCFTIDSRGAVSTKDVQMTNSELFNFFGQEMDWNAGAKSSDDKGFFLVNSTTSVISVRRFNH